MSVEILAPAGNAECFKAAVYAGANAIYIGFTGTPVETKDKSTSSIFGDVIDTYDMTQAILDGSTVPISYESRMARVGLNQKILDEIDRYYAFVEESGVADDIAINKSKQMMATISQVIEDPDRLELIVKDIISHYEERKNMFLNLYKKGKMYGF